jgi:hypothetical protein
MNNQPINNQPVSDDNDLAKVLTGADGQLPEPVVSTPVETAVVDEPAITPEEPTPVSIPEPLTAPVPSSHEELESIKKEALEELKPLVDKLNLPPEEKFDILLLIIRSTDDEELVAKAHDTAAQIEDDGRKAQALLDIIKEVDYFSNK